jgi:hypothetical protein
LTNPSLAARRDTLSSTFLAGLRNVTLSWPNAVGLVQKEFPIRRGRFRVLVDGHDDRLDVVIAPTFMARSMPDFGERFNPWRIWVSTKVDGCLVGFSRESAQEGQEPAGSG